MGEQHAKNVQHSSLCDVGLDSAVMNIYNI